MIRYIEHPSPLGNLVLAASERGLCGLYFEEHKYFRGTHAWERDSAHQHLRTAASQLDDYFAGRRNAFDLPLDLRGTPFQQAVWQALMTLGYGSTSSYAAIARQVANPNAVRAAGTAIGRNPVSIIVPCHRVLGTTGGLSGYAGGVERKRFLLALERGAAQSGSVLEERQLQRGSQ